MARRFPGLHKHLNDMADNAEVPPASVRDGEITPETVKRYPEYYILGAGRDKAQATQCAHGYNLTDSCPCCD